MKPILKPNWKLISLESLSAFGEKIGAAAYNAVLAFVSLAKRNPKIVAVIIAVLLLAWLTSLAADSGMRDVAKEKQAAQEKLFRDHQLKRAEDAQRAKIAVDAQRKGELQNEITRFSNALGYDMQRLNATGAEYGSDKLNDYNLAKKMAAVKKMILVINEFKSHLDAYEQFIHENFAEMKRLGIAQKNMTEAEALKESTTYKIALKSMLEGGEAELEQFVGSNRARLKIAGEVLQLAKDSLELYKDVPSMPQKSG